MEIPSMVQKLGPFYWRGGFCILFWWSFSSEGSAINGATPSTYTKHKKEQINKAKMYLFSPYRPSGPIRSSNRDVPPFVWYLLLLSKLFPVDHKSPWYFRKKGSLKTKEKWSEIFNWGPPRQARQAKKTSSPWKIIKVTHSRKVGLGCGSGVIIVWLKLFFFNFSDLVHSCTRAPVAAGNRR